MNTFLDQFDIFNKYNFTQYLYTNTCKYVCIFNLQGRTSLHEATSNGNIRMVKFLIEKGADLSDRDNTVSTNDIRS